MKEIDYKLAFESLSAFIDISRDSTLEESIREKSKLVSYKYKNLVIYYNTKYFASCLFDWKDSLEVNEININYYKFWE